MLVITSAAQIDSNLTQADSNSASDSAQIDSNPTQADSNSAKVVLNQSMYPTVVPKCIHLQIKFIQMPVILITFVVY